VRMFGLLARRWQQPIYVWISDIGDWNRRNSELAWYVEKDQVPWDVNERGIGYNALSLTLFVLYRKRSWIVLLGDINLSAQLTLASISSRICTKL
jgi:hypothetical protein